MKDSDVVDAFVAYLNENGHPGIRVDSRPDESNSETSDIDALAGHFAIEHTSIDTVPNQRRDANRFKRVTGNLEQEFVDVLPYRLEIILKYHAVGVGQDWDQIQKALRQWISEESAAVPNGRTIIEDIDQIPFQLHVSKSSSRRPGVFFARYEPMDDSLVQRVKATLERKSAKLARYKEPEITTLLLVESNDLALMNELKLLDAIKAAFPSGLLPDIDQLWYVDTSIEQSLLFRDFTAEINDGAA